MCHFLSRTKSELEQNLGFVIADIDCDRHLLLKAFCSYMWAHESFITHLNVAGTAKLMLKVDALPRKQLV